MNLQGVNNTELSELLVAALEGTITPERFAQLEILLLTSPEALQYYVEFLVVSGGLHYSVETAARNEASASSDSAEWLFAVLEQERAAATRRAECEAAQRERERAEARERREGMRLMLGEHEAVVPYRHIVIPRAAAYGVVAAVAAMLLLMVYTSFRPNTVGAPPVEQMAEQTPVELPVLAKIIESLDLIWLEDSLPTQRGSALHRGTHTLVKGIVQVEFSDGAVAIIQAPAVFELETESSMRLMSGKLTAEVSSRAVGFTVRAPQARIVDLGTQFGVAVDPSHAGETEVHVFEGEVVLNLDQRQDKPGVVRKLIAGKASRIDAQGKVAPLVCDAMAFVRTTEFEARRLAQQGSAYHRWLAHSFDIRRDPSLVAYYMFEQGEDERYRLMNFAPNATGLWGHLGLPEDATTAPTWVTGRWKQKGALRFTASKHQRVIVPDWSAAKVDTELTIAGWYRMTSTHGWQLLATQWNDDMGRFSFHLGILGEYADSNLPQHVDARLQLHLMDPVKPKERLFVKDERRHGTTTTPADGWVHIACTIVANGGPVRLYKNGEEIDLNGATFEGSHLLDINEPLVLGGKAARTPRPYALSHYCDGVMDEMAFFRRALSSQEIRHMYEQGRPN